MSQLHPGALYLLGAVYLTGDCVREDIGSAMWCFHRAAQKVSNDVPAAQLLLKVDTFCLLRRVAAPSAPVNLVVKAEK